MLGDTGNKRAIRIPLECNLVVFFIFRLCCAELSNDQKLLSAGFEDSSLRVWSLTPKTIYSENAEVNVARINLAGDLIEDIQERQR